MAVGGEAGEIELAAEAFSAFEQYDLVAAAGGDPGGLQTSGATADHDDATTRRCSSNGGIVDRRLAPDGRVHRAAEFLHEKATEATVKTTNAGPRVQPGGCSADQVRVGNRGSHHGHHRGIPPSNDGLGLGEGQDSTGHDARRGDRSSNRHGVG